MNNYGMQSGLKSRLTELDNNILEMKSEQINLQLTNQQLVNEKEKLLYAPMTDVGSVVYDKDATIMEIGHIHQNESSDLVDQLKTQALDQRNPGLRLFANSAILTEEEVEKAEKCATSPYICFYFNFFFSYVFFCICQKSFRQEPP